MMGPSAAPMKLALDHLVVAARTLAEGTQWCEATLGVAPGQGGRHALFGTHNALVKIASAAFPRAYLEIIAIDPGADAAARLPRPRWFALDEPGLQARIAAAPRLVHWVARSEEPAAHRAAFAAAGHDPGTPLQAWRDTPHGRLEWEITVPADGALACGGALPTLIRWRGAHPVDALPAAPVRLRVLQLRGLPPRSGELFGLAGVQHDAAPGPALRAVLDTPRGQITLESP